MQKRFRNALHILQYFIFKNNEEINNRKWASQSLVKFYAFKGELNFIYVFNTCFLCSWNFPFRSNRDNSLVDHAIVFSSRLANYFPRDDRRNEARRIELNWIGSSEWANSSLQFTASVTRLLTAGGTSLLAMQRYAPICRLSTRWKCSNEPL